MPAAHYVVLPPPRKLRRHGAQLFAQLWLILGCFGDDNLPSCGNLGGKLEPLSAHNLSFPKFVDVCPKLQLLASLLFHSRCHWARVARPMTLRVAYSIACHCREQRLFPKVSNFCTSLSQYNNDGRCCVVRCQNLLKYQRTKVIFYIRPKMCKIARNFGATYPIFCATSATNLAQVLDLF